MTKWIRKLIGQLGGGFTFQKWQQRKSKHSDCEAVEERSRWFWFHGFYLWCWTGSYCHYTSILNTTLTEYSHTTTGRLWNVSISRLRLRLYSCAFGSVFVISECYNYYSAPVGVWVAYCDQTVRLCVCLSASISLEPLDGMSRIFVHIPCDLAVARSSPGGAPLRYVGLLPVFGWRHVWP